ncbi:MAG TPA: 3-oxoacyl-ACP synthase [Cytophagales bacterium]|nr:3-oxoacyl-ACP synthase [Cytophagales bacterium]
MVSISFKAQLYKLCLEQQLKKVETAKNAMDDAQESANSEERSTAGDKYDTSRAMSQNVRDMNARQLQDALKELAILQQINIETKNAAVKAGSVVMTSTGNYFIAVSAGELKLDDKTFFAISPASPLGQVLINKKAGEKITFREKTIAIKEIL